MDRLQLETLHLSTDPADDHDVVWRGPGPVLAVQLHDDPLRQPGEHRHQTSDRRVRHSLKYTDGVNFRGNFFTIFNP